MSERPRYFFGRVIGVDDLALEQLYHREKARRHNRFLHGWGIVRGLEVQATIRGTPEVTISPGYALDRRRGGDRRLAVRHRRSLGTCGRNNHVRRAALRRAPERPVPTPRGPQYSRVRETFAVEVLVRVPPQKPLVVLADVELGRGGKVEKIGTARRRYVGD